MLNANGESVCVCVCRREEIFSLEKLVQKRCNSSNHGFLKCMIFNNLIASFFWYTSRKKTHISHRHIHSREYRMDKSKCGERRRISCAYILYTYMQKKKKYFRSPKLAIFDFWRFLAYRWSSANQLIWLTGVQKMYKQKFKCVNKLKVGNWGDFFTMW